MVNQKVPLLKNEDELSKCIELLKIKRQEIHEKILKEEESKERMQKELSLLSEKLQDVCDSINRKYQTRLEYDKTIKETSAAYSKIRESAKSLLHILKREESQLGDKIYTVANDEDIKSLRELRTMHK
uniref:13 kDa deflagellation-inducible protein-like n=1 Tax=Piliocolobus tephrosceles TaxID=591936 RepID=A0A8C9GJF7_9PRIM